MAYAVRSPSSTVFAPSVCRGPASKHSIALTFDDGPSESTPDLLQLLERHRVPATFFQCGANVERLPEIACATAAGGHEIGNHSHTHPRFYFRTRGFMETELSRAQAAIACVTGIGPTLFRAPFGIRWPGMRRAQSRLGLMGVMWTVIGRDWKLRADAIVRRVLPRACNGAIICLHDGRGLEKRPGITETLEAVRRLIPALQEQGYRFETVSQLICPTN
jgi:peptidoglycan/xylan/chitin deacetylase (PgdA/CDA1 family)